MNNKKINFKDSRLQKKFVVAAVVDTIRFQNFFSTKRRLKINVLVEYPLLSKME